MKMQEAMTALTGGQTVDVRTVVSSATSDSSPGSGGGRTTTQQRSERQVSLG